jgi:CRP-like cAMP-binding protein
VDSDDVRTLSGIKLFQGLEEAERRRLEARCLWRWYKRGEPVLECGSDSREVFFVVQGTVNAVNISPTGREVAFSTIGAGDCFGELSAIDGKPRSAGVVANEDTFLAILPSEIFVELLQSQAGVAFKLLQRLTRMARTGSLRVMELSTMAASDRVYTELLRMAKPDAAVPGRWVVHPLPPLREIASRVSTTRETVARALGQLYRDGLVRRRGRVLYLTDRDKLEAYVAARRLEGT